MKRNCRRTERERQQHERAVAIRKMTDEQLCEYIDGAIAESDGNGNPDPVDVIRDFLDALEGVTTLRKRLSKQTTVKIRKLAVEMGYLPEVDND